MKNALLTVNALKVGYSKQPILSAPVLSVHSGEIVTLIGANGCGKSTLLKTIIGQLPPLSGTLFLSGREMSTCSPLELAKQLSILMTDRVRPEQMTCWEVASMGRYPYTGRLGILSESDREKVRSALVQTDALDLADRPFTALSDGQRQRVLLARALCQEPSLLVLDEPTSFLDIRYKLELLTVLRRAVKQDGLAVLMSLHELDLAQMVSDRLVCISHGEIDRIGRPDEIFCGNYIAQLYQLKPEQYDPCFDRLELLHC